MSPTYEFDNLSENKCMWEAGSAKNRSGGQVSGRGAQSRRHGRTSTVREDGRVPTLHWFFALPAQGAHAARSGYRSPGGSLVNREHDPGTYVDESVIKHSS